MLIYRRPLPSRERGTQRDRAFIWKNVPTRVLSSNKFPEFSECLTNSLHTRMSESGCVLAYPRCDFHVSAEHPIIVYANYLPLDSYRNRARNSRNHTTPIVWDMWHIAVIDLMPPLSHTSALQGLMGDSHQ